MNKKVNKLVKGLGFFSIVVGLLFVGLVYALKKDLMIAEIGKLFDYGVDFMFNRKWVGRVLTGNLLIIGSVLVALVWFITCLKKKKFACGFFGTMGVLGFSASLMMMYKYRRSFIANAEYHPIMGKAILFVFVFFLLLMALNIIASFLSFSIDMDDEKCDCKFVNRLSKASKVFFAIFATLTAVAAVMALMFRFEPVMRRLPKLYHFVLDLINIDKWDASNIARNFSALIAVLFAGLWLIKNRTKKRNSVGPLALVVVTGMTVAWINYKVTFDFYVKYGSVVLNVALYAFYVLFALVALSALLALIADAIALTAKEKKVDTVSIELDGDIIKEEPAPVEEPVDLGGDLVEVIDENNKKLIINRRLFINKLCLAEDDLKRNYNIIKNAILKYEKVRSRISASYESFRRGRKLLVRFNILGKTLRVYLALDPNEYPVTVYHQRNEGDKRKYELVPMMLRVRSPRSVKNAVKLIDELMEKEGIALAKNYEEVDYIKELKFDTTPVEVKPVEETPVVEPVVEEVEEVEESIELGGDLIEVIDENNKKLIINKRLYTNKLCLAEDDLKRNYNVIKNAILKYAKVRSRISASYESFRKGRKLLVRFNVLGKTLRVYLALDPNEYPVTVYHQRNEGDKRKYESVPMMLRVRSPRSVRNAVKLIDELMEKEGIALAKNYEEVDYAKEFKYDSNALLIKDGFKNLVREEIDEAHADDLSDDEAMRVVVTKEVEEEVTPKHKTVAANKKNNKAIVNVDQINQVFDYDEYVTIEKLKEKGLVNKKTNYVKVLSRGVINKPMTIEANEFSLKAVKMIVLTGGSVVRLVEHK